MKPTSKFRILSTLCILVIAFANTACKKEPKCDTVVVEGGIQGQLLGPKWLVHHVDSLTAHHRDNEVWEEFIQITVYSVIHDEEYIFVLDWTKAQLPAHIFTCRGKRIPYDGIPNSLHSRLISLYGITTVAVCSQNILWSRDRGLMFFCGK